MEDLVLDFGHYLEKVIQSNFYQLKKENKFTLLQHTIKRISTLKNLKKPILVCNEEHRFIVAEQMRELNIDDFIILLEPFGRNTAPAIICCIEISRT